MREIQKVCLPLIEYSGKLSIEAATAIAQANYTQKTQEEIITLKQRIAELEKSLAAIEALQQPASGVIDEPKKYRGITCRGSWEFGNNCKTCQRCIETKPVSQ